MPIISIAMLVFAVGFNFYLYRYDPTAKVDSNDNSFQYALVHRTNDVWDFAVKTIREGRHRLIILDELTYLISYNMIEEQDVLDVLADRPKNMHVAITGRNASPGLIEAADVVTEMQSIKHAYDNGVQAQKGIEF